MMKTIKKTSMILLIAMVAFAYLPAMNVAEISNAVAKPGTVKKAKMIGQNYSTITLKWKKAKNAKKYQVFMKKGKKLKKVATTNKTKAKITKLKCGKTYYFVIRGINGKTKGDYSKAFKIKKGKFHPKPLKAHKINTSNLKEGDTYVIVSDSGEKEKVTITSNDTYKGGYNIIGETKEGGEFIMSYDKSIGQESYIMDNDSDCNHMIQDWTYDEELLSNTLRFKIKDNDTKVYFTLDGTEPKVGQADLVGKSKMVAFMKSLEEQVPVYYDTPIRGTLKGKGTHLVNTGNNTVNKSRCSWYKAYYKGNLFCEFKQKVME